MSEGGFTVKGKSFWSSIPGLLTAVGGFIAAITSFIAGLHHAGLIGVSSSERMSTSDRGAATSERLQPEEAALLETRIQTPQNEELRFAKLVLGGSWQAEVTYDWGAKHVEKLHFNIRGDEIHGTASFLGTPRALLDGRVGGGKITFVTKTPEVLGDFARKTQTHRYSGVIESDRIEFVMYTEGGYSEHVPIEFAAYKMPNQ